MHIYIGPLIVFAIWFWIIGWGKFPYQAKVFVTIIAFVIEVLLLSGIR